MNENIPAEVTAHLAEMVRSSEDAWAKEKDALEKLEASWLEKSRLFEEQIALMKMEFVDAAEADDERGMILVTYSGSLVSLGPGSKRRFGYASIKIRSEVPDILNGEDAGLAEALWVGGPAVFTNAPVKSTSALYRIAVTPAGLSAEDAEARVREAMVFLTASFVHINRRLTVADGAPGHFDKKTIIRYLADNSGLSQKAVRGVLDDYAVLLETGMLMGQTVALGPIGRLSLTLKPAQKARVGRNPATGEEITIAAKPARMAPAFKFSARSKERAGNLPVPEED